MDTFGLPITCQRCAGPVRLVNCTANLGTQSLAVVRCEACRVEFTVETTMRVHRLAGEEQRVATAS